MKKIYESAKYLFLNATILLIVSSILTNCASKQNLKNQEKKRITEVEKPNILFIMVDDLGKEWISSYGADSIKTPAIDQMAREGMKFHNAWSMPQCTPTRTALLTGIYPWKQGWVNHWDVPRWGHGYFDWDLNKTFASYMREAGYKTAAAGKWQINDFRLAPDAMKKHGFDEWLMWTGYETGIPASGERYWDPYINGIEGSKTYEGLFGPDMFTDFLIDFMKKNKNDPMMMYYPMVLTHGPLVNTPDEPDSKGKERHRSMVRYTDKLVQKLLNTIDELEIADKTMVIFTTDNGTDRSITGWRNGRKVKGGKGTKVEAGVCEPFIVRWSGKIPAGSESYALTDFTDLLPTFLEVAGTSATDKELDGTSILQVLLDKQKDTSREWIMALGHGPGCLDDEGVRGINDYADRVIRDKEYKAWTEYDSKITRLHNIEDDPYEEVNLLGNLNAKDQKALEKFQAILNLQPQRDGRPAYRPRAANEWDLTTRNCK